MRSSWHVSNKAHKTTRATRSSSAPPRVREGPAVPAHATTMQPPSAASGNNNANALKVHTPLICGGHSRPVPFLSYSGITEDGFFLISACLGTPILSVDASLLKNKDGKPMLRNGQTGDWIGTFMGHKGAVWAATLTNNALLGATGSADYTA